GKSSIRPGHAVESYRGMASAQQEVRKGREGLVVTIGDHRSDGVGVVVEADAILSLVGAAEVASNAEPVIQLSSDRGIPAIRVHSGNEPAGMDGGRGFKFWPGRHFPGQRRQGKTPEAQTNRY